MSCSHVPLCRSMCDLPSGWFDGQRWSGESGSGTESSTSGDDDDDDDNSSKRPTVPKLDLEKPAAKPIKPAIKSGRGVFDSNASGCTT